MSDDRSAARLLSGGSRPPPESLSAAEHSAARRTSHHRGSLQPELPPLLAPSVELQTLVVLRAAEQGLELLVRRVLRHALLQDLDGLLLLAPLVLAPGVDAVEQRLALVPAHGGVEDLLHLRILLAAEKDGGEHRLGEPELDHGGDGLAQVR